jgi:restriction endonuclease
LKFALGLIPVISTGGFVEIRKIAKNYLANDPSGWLALSKALSARIAVWGTQAIEGVGGSVTEIDIEETVLPELLSPTTVSLVSQGADSQAIVVELIRLIDEAVGKVQTSVNFKASNFNGTKTPDYWLESDKPFNDKFGYSVIDFSLDRYDLENIIIELIDDEAVKSTVSSEPFSSVGGLVYRLDDIDPTIYKTLIDKPELLRTLEWRTFEKLLADALESLGFEIELQKGTKDGGVDLFAVKRKEIMGPQRFLIQAKRYKNKVGVSPVRQLLFLHSDHRVTKVCLATTSTFTKGAWELEEQYKWQLELKDFDGVHSWIRQAAKQRLNF